MGIDIKNNKINYQKVGLIIFIIAICVYSIFAIIDFFNDNKKLNNNHKYTIGYVTNIENYGKSGGRVVYFDMSIKNQKIQGKTNITKIDTSILNRRFFVMFYPLQPTNCKILLNCPAADTLKAPKEGWEKMPLIDRTKTIYLLNY